MNYESFVKIVDTISMLPDKKKNSYLAVGEMIKEGRDLSSITISEVAKKAGIGKGTVYEYFESKEDLISKAIYYLLFNSTKDVVFIIFEKISFKEKFYKILDYMWDNRVDNSTLHQVIDFIHSTGRSQEQLSFPFCAAGENSEIKKVLKKILSDFVDQGVKEGVITEKNPVYRNNVFCSQLFLYIFLLQDTEDESKKKEIEDYVYNGMISILNMEH